MDSEDTFAALAKRYGTTAALLSSANHDELPEAGALVVIPAAYPGDRIPVRADGRSDDAPEAHPTAPGIGAEDRNVSAHALSIRPRRRRRGEEPHQGFDR